METMLLIFDSMKEFLSSHNLFNFGLLLLAGYIMGKIAERFNLPAITGYIIAGLILGRSVTGFIEGHKLHNFHIITEAALGFIALTIGGEFYFPKLKKTGMKILIITLFEAVFAFIFVSIILYLLGMELEYSLLLASIAAATAPAATVIIIKELRARGEFVDYLYGVVAFDDAICVILFSIIFSLTAPVIAGTAVAHSSILPGILHVGREILFSFLIGISGGIVLHLVTKNKYKTNEILIISLSIIFICTALSIILKLSLLLTNMAFGAALVNLSHRNNRIFNILEPVTPPIFAMFFILAGTELDLSVFTKSAVIVYGVFYLISRFAGKFTGTYISSVIVRAPENVRKYLSFCLFPQAGVAIGLALFVQNSNIFETASESVKALLLMIVNIILISVFINELIGPVISRFGIKRGADL